LKGGEVYVVGFAVAIWVDDVGYEEWEHRCEDLCDAYVEDVWKE
jgi:hypothetical protein